jgi:hypothetical protein
MELQDFIARLRPNNIFPNTLIPYLDGIDWACLPGIFAHCLTPQAYETLRQSTLDGLRTRFPGIDLSPKGMKLRAEQALRKISRPDSDRDNAVGSSDHGQWKQEQSGRIRRTRAHIEEYLPWLFGPQDIPVSATGQDRVPEVDPRPASAVAESKERCATCAHCLTCGPKRQNSSSGQVSAGQTDIPLGTPSITPTRTTSSPGVGLPQTPSASPAIPAQRNDQMYSPPAESPPVPPHTTPHFSDRTLELTANVRPNKRPRLELGQMPLLEVPNAAQVAFTPGDIRRASNPVPSLERTRPEDETSTFSASHQLCDPRTRTVPKNNHSPKQLESSGKVAAPQPDVDGPWALARPSDPAAQRLKGPRLPNNSQLLRSKTTGSMWGGARPSSSATSFSSVTTQSTSFHSSDQREQRRLSKIKERDIRSQLAKLPPEFSQSLAATKSVMRTRPTTPNRDTGSTRNVLVERMQSGDFGPLDLDLSCVGSQSQGKGVS